MVDSQTFYICLAVCAVAVVIAYCLGRVDGWCKRGAAELTRVNPDSARLDWLDRKCAPYVEGQSYSWPYGEHVANEWSLIWPESSLRAAIDAGMEQESMEATDGNVKA